MIKLKWIVILSWFYSGLVSSACLDYCPTPHEQIMSGKIENIRVVKIKNPPSKSEALKCEILMTNPKIWKGKLASSLKVYTSWEARFCKNKFKVGEEILIAGFGNTREWLQLTAGDAMPIYRPEIYQGDEAESRLEYLQNASKEELNDEELYCIQIRRRVCLPLNKTAIKVTSQHSAVISVSSHREPPEGYGAIQVEYELDDSGKLKKRPGIRTADIKHSIRINFEEIVECLRFSNLEKHKGRCFFVTLIIDGEHLN